MKHRLANNGIALALVLFVAAPLSHLLLLSLSIHLSVWWVLLFSCAALLLLETVAANKYTAIGIPAFLALAALFTWLLLREEGRAAVGAFFEWAVGFLSINLEYPLHYAILFTALLTFLVTLFLWLFGKKFFCFPLVLLFTAGLILLEWLGGHFDILTASVLAGGALLPLWAKSFQRGTARKTGKRLSENGIALSLVPVVLLCSLLTLPIVSENRAQGWQSRTVYDLFDRVNNYVADYTGFTRPRSSYSIGYNGFMPMGSRLGGPVKLVGIDMLEVAANKQVLLRGTIYNSYDGKSWSEGWADTGTGRLPNRRYRLNSSNQQYLNEAFDLTRPALPEAYEAEYSRFVKQITVAVNPLRNSPSTLFAPYRGVTAVSSDHFLAVLPYFNDEGELFSTTDIKRNYSYKISANYLDYNADGFEDLMDQLLSLGLEDSAERTAFVRDNYLSLGSAQPEAALIDLTHSITAGATNDYRKAMAIQDYLRENCKYTLEPPVPPESIDFASYFVDHDPQGYCTYFATAMTVMARIAGIPARYVEGYMMANRDANRGVYVIKTDNAHAWAELYFAGIGWIPFDATPLGQSDDGAGNGVGSGADILPTPPIPEETGPTGPVAPIPVRHELTPEEIQRIAVISLASVAALLVLAVIAMMIRARVLYTPRYLQQKYANNRLRVAYLYFSLLKLLAYYNYPLRRGETLYAYAARIDRWLRLPAGTFGQVAELMVKISYSDYDPTDRDVGFISAFRRELARYTYQTVGPWFYLWYQVLGFRRKTAQR